MALALMFSDDSVLYLDAVQNYTKSRSSNISNHPIDKSANVTDHVSKNNPTFSLKGTVSAADFNTSYVRASDFSDYNVTGENDRLIDDAEITSKSSLLDYLPGSVQQFLTQENPVEVSVNEFRGYSHQVARERLERAWEDCEIITLLDFDFDFSTGRSIAIRKIEDCLIDNLTDSEDSQTGDALEFTLTLTKVRFAYLKQVDIKVTKSSVKDGAAGKSDKGEVSTEASSDAERNKTEWQRSGFAQGILNDVSDFSGIFKSMLKGGS